MKRSIAYVGLFSVMTIVPGMTEQAFAVNNGNTSDAITNSITITVVPPWISFPNTPDPNVPGIPPTTPSTPSTPSTPVVEPTTPPPSPDKTVQESETELKNKKPKVGSPRY